MSSKPCSREQADDVLHHRPVRERHHRLGLVARERAQPRALAAGQDHGLHARHLRASFAGPRGRPAARARAAGMYVRRGVVAEDEPADREAPGDDSMHVDACRRCRCVGARGTAGSANISASVPALPDPQHVDAPGPGRAPARASTTLIDGLPGEHERSRPTSGTLAVDEQADRAGDEQDPVGDRVEDLAELAALVEVAGDLAVDPVGGAEHREQDPGRERLVLGPRSSQRNTGTHASRATEMRFGIVQTPDRARVPAPVMSWPSVRRRAGAGISRSSNWTPTRGREDRAACELGDHRDDGRDDPGRRR